MFYGIIHEEYYLNEINIKETLIKIKNAVKKAILTLIKKIYSLVDKMKDCKFKSALKSILNKLKKLLGDNEEAKTEKEQKAVIVDLQRYKEETARTVEAMEKDNEKWQEIFKDFPKTPTGDTAKDNEALSKWLDGVKNSGTELGDKLKKIEDDFENGRTIVFD